MTFQIVRVELNDAGEIVSPRLTEPLFEVRDHAMAIAEFDAAHGYGEYGYDRVRHCWWSRDDQELFVRYVIEAVPLEVAA